MASEHRMMWTPDGQMRSVHRGGVPGEPLGPWSEISGEIIEWDDLAFDEDDED